MKEPNNAKIQERRVAEDLWLSYFNRYLYEHGVITEQERNKMVVKIAERKHRVSPSHQEDPMKPEP